MCGCIRRRAERSGDAGVERWDLIRDFVRARERRHGFESRMGLFNVLSAQIASLGSGTASARLSFRRSQDLHFSS